MVTGPILLFFASAILASGGDESPDDSGAALSQYFAVSRPFFLLLAAVQVWIIGADLLLGTGFTSAALPNVFAAALALILASSQKKGTHAVGVIVAWVLLLIASVLRATGTIG